MAIHFSNQNTVFKLKEKARIKSWIALVVAKEKKTIGTISYVFMTDDDLLEVNEKYLKHNTYTDIITFDYTEEKKISGDIFISVDRIQENAQKLKVNFEEELHRVIIHGVLHLCGYKDKTKIDSDLMRKKENASLKLFNNSK